MPGWFPVPGRIDRVLQRLNEGECVLSREPVATDAGASADGRAKPSARQSRLVGVLTGGAGHKSTTKGTTAVFFSDGSTDAATARRLWAATVCCAGFLGWSKCGQTRPVGDDRCPLAANWR